MKDFLLPQLCGLFAVIASCAAVWILGSMLWEARDAILQAIIAHPVATVFWTACVGLAVSFGVGIRS